MSKSLKTADQRGFTILELMIATLVFSVIFLATSTALLQIGKLYYKGLITTRTQETTRGIADQLSQQLQFGGIQPRFGGPTAFTVTGANGGKLSFSAICIGNTRYTYRINTQTKASTPTGTYVADSSQLKHGLWKDAYNGSDCPPLNLSDETPSPVAPDPAAGQDVLSQNSRLTQFSVTPDTKNASLYIIKIGIIYGDNDLLTPDPTNDSTNPASLRCGNIIGDQWCAGSQFTTTVLQRVGNN